MKKINNLQKSKIFEPQKPKILRKGQIWVSVIIYTMVAILSLVLILNTGIPLLSELKDRAIFEKVKDIMIDLDAHVTTIASQGIGSQATVAFEIRDGVVKFTDDSFMWEIETDKEIISPRSKSQIGNLIVSSNANVKTYDVPNYYILETVIKNDTFRAYFNKQGSKNSWTAFTTSDIINNVSFNAEPMDGTFTFNLNGNTDTESGTGYTEMVPSGNNSYLGRAKVIAHMNTTFAKYDLEYTLDSLSDFVKVNVKNIEIK
jgi:hypothetical protein